MRCAIANIPCSGDVGPRYMRGRITRLVDNEQMVVVWNEIVDAVMRGALHIAVEVQGVCDSPTRLR